MEPGPPELGVRSLNHWTTRKVPGIVLISPSFLKDSYTGYRPLDQQVFLCHFEYVIVSWLPLFLMRSLLLILSFIILSLDVVSCFALAAT